jgi:hypothetical protein
MIVRRAMKNSTVVAGGGAIDVWNPITCDTSWLFISERILGNSDQTSDLHRRWK